MFPVGNNSARQVSAAIGKHFGGERTSSAAVGHPCRGVLHTPPMFMAENNNARQASVAIGKHFGGEWVPSAHKWFPTEANGYRAHVLENILGANERHRPLSDARVGAYCIRPRCSWPRTIAPIGHPPQLGNISGANERHRPLSDVRVGAQKHTPPMFRVGNNSARQVSAAIGFHFIGGWVSTAAVGFVPCGVI